MSHSNVYAIGVDYGTNAVRAIIVDCSNGQEISSGIFSYPSGQEGIILDSTDVQLARQHPQDYITGLKNSIKAALDDATQVAGFSADAIIGIGIDSTGSTPIPVDADNRPLALDPKWSQNPAAMAWLWKDHTSHQEAEAITRLANELRPQYLKKYGNVYSSEWFWAKIWRCLKVAPDVFTAAYSWVELCDYIPSLLCGIDNPQMIKRGICAAGHKAIFHEEWGGLPDKEFLSQLDPQLAALRDRLYTSSYDASTPAGLLCEPWAKELNLKPQIPIAIGAFDAHYGAIGAGIQSGTLVKIIGTSTCDCMVAPMEKPLKDIPGVCGTVPGSILPGYYGIEAGQSAVGDIFKWFVEGVCHREPEYHLELTEQAKQLYPGQSGLLGLDWHNGNRTTLVDSQLTGLMLGQTLQTTPAEIYRSLIESTAFGARAIIERISDYGVPIDRIVCCGGIAEKNPLLMQIYADVTGCVIETSRSSQTCALGSAIAVAVSSGYYKTFQAAQEAMTKVKPHSYLPDLNRKKVYDQLYGLYIALYEGFGGQNRSTDLSNLMKELIAIKNNVERRNK